MINLRSLPSPTARYAVTRGDKFQLAITSWVANSFQAQVVVEGLDGIYSTHSVSLRHLGDRSRMTAESVSEVVSDGIVIAAYIGYSEGTATVSYGDAFAALSILRSDIPVEQLASGFVYRDHVVTLGSDVEYDSVYDHFKSWSEQRNYNPLLDAGRNVLVYDMAKTWWNFTPKGRVLLADDFELNPTALANWTATGTGTPIFSVVAVRGHSGIKSVSLSTRTATPTIGDYAQIAKNITLPADLEGFHTGMYFSLDGNTNLRSIELKATIRSQVLARTVVGGIQYHKRQLGAAQDIVKYWDSTGAWVNAITDYAIPDGATSINLWTILGMQAIWKSGLYNTPLYDVLRIGDRAYQFATPKPLWQDTGVVPTYSACLLELRIITDTAAATIAFLDDIYFNDLSPTFV